MTRMKSNRMVVRRRGSASLAGAAVALALAAGSAQGQTAWASAVNGSWFDPTKWTAGVPGATTPTTLGLVGAYTASIQNGSAFSGPLTISNPVAILRLFDNTQFSVKGNISNNGLIQISDAGAPGNLTNLAPDGNISIGGTGTLRLAPPGNGNNDQAYLWYVSGGNVLTNSAGHTIAGKGRVYTNLVNDGTVNADVAGGTLYMIQQPKANNAMMTASNGGALQFSSVALTQGGAGVCQSNNSSPVQIASTMVTGGTLNGAGTGPGIQYFGASSLHGVTLANLNAVQDNSSVVVGATGVVNNGTWTVSSPGAPGNLTNISAGANTTIGGTGTLRLQGIGAGNNDSAYLTFTAAANVLTNGPSHSIRGYGRVYTNLSNNGTVNADVAGKTLYLLQQPKANQGTMTASNGGILQFSGVTVTGDPAAQVISTDSASPVQIVNSTMTGGGFTTSGTGLFQYFGSNALANLTVNGTHQIEDNSVVTVTTNLVNNGSWLISKPTAPGNLTHMDAGASITISGTGTIRLQGIGAGNNDSGYLAYSAPGNVLTLGTNQQLLGYGRVYTNLVTMGTVNADVAGKTLYMLQLPKANKGTMTASNGGILQFSGITVTGDPAAQVISTDSSSPVQMVNATMTGGGFTTSGTGLFQYFGANTLANLTVNGTHQIEDNSVVSLATDLVNNGTWLISKPAAPGNLTHMDVSGGAVTVSGTGVIRLQGVQGGNGDNDSAYIHYSNAANVLTLGAGQQLRGYGRVYAGMVNNGLINADNTPNGGGPATKIMVLMNQPKTNNATVTSSNEGQWQIRGIPLTQGANGVLSSSNTTVQGGHFHDCSVTGGKITNIANRFFTTSGAPLLSGVEITAGSGVQVSDNSTLSTPGLTNNGTISIQSVGGPGNLTSMRATVDGATVGGTGTVRLNSINGQPSNDTAYLQTANAGGITAVFGPGQTLAGIGRIYHKWTFQGTVSPGQTATGSGTFEAHGGLVSFAPTTTYVVHANGSSGSGNYDRITGGSAKAIDGKLVFTFEGGYTPSISDKYDIITGPSGSITGVFSAVQTPSPFGRARIHYLHDRVRVAFCYGDCDGDDTLSIDDFICFQTQFALADMQADCDEDGVLSIDDFICFQTFFAIGC